MGVENATVGEEDGVGRVDFKTTSEGIGKDSRPIRVSVYTEDGEGDGSRYVHTLPVYEP